MSEGNGEMLNQVFGGIEGKEQKIIQSLRTAGLRKATETNIIDQILDIRRDRRRIFSDLMQVCDKQRSRTTELEKQVDQLRDDQLRRERRYHVSLEEHQRKAKHEADVATMALKKVHERKLHELHAKLDQVTSIREDSDNAKIKDVAKKMTQLELSKQREFYEAKMIRYKEAVRDLYERGKNVESQVLSQKQAATDKEAKLENMERKVQDQAKDNTELVKTITELQSRLAKAEASLVDEQTENATLRIELNRKDDYIAAATRSAAERHASELESVDEKVRAVLARKDGEVRQVVQENVSLNRELQQLKDSLQSVFR